MAVDKSEIQKQAKEILDKFAKALEKVKTEKKEDFYVKREEFERGEESSKKKAGNCEDFKPALLENAPRKNEDFVVAEKRGWKKWEKEL